MKDGDMVLTTKCKPAEAASVTRLPTLKNVCSLRSTAHSCLHVALEYWRERQPSELSVG